MRGRYGPRKTGGKDKGMVMAYGLPARMKKHGSFNKLARETNHHRKEGNCTVFSCSVGEREGVVEKKNSQE